MTNSKPVALWAVPRSISTAFERVFVERDDFEVLHEPFSAAYYYGEDRVSDRFAGAESKPEYSYERVVEDVFRPREERVFVKDMAYQAKKVLSPEFASRFVNTFIIRDPKYVLMSLYKMWPDFTLEETGYEDLYRLFKYTTDAGEDVAVVDAMTFSENPAGRTRRLLRAPRGAVHIGFAHVGVEGCQEMGQLGGMARGCREQHGYRAGRTAGPQAPRGVGGRVRVLFTLLLRAGRARDPIRGAAIGK